MSGSATKGSKVRRRGARKLLRALHAFSTFDTGGPQRRACELAQMWGYGVEHTVVAMDDRFGAAQVWPRDVSLEMQPPPDGSVLKRISTMRRILREHDPDVVLTYNWGAIEWVLAARLAGMVGRVVHHEDGFGVEERERPLWRRSMARRLLLPRVGAVVVPSSVLARIGREQWKLAQGHLHHLPNGVDLEHFTPELVRGGGNAVVFGVVGGLRAVKNQALAIEALASIERPRSGEPAARLRIVGDGPDHEALTDLAQGLGVADAVDFVGHVTDTAAEYVHMDALLISSKSEQMPLALLEAMACGLPVVSTDVGDVREVLSPDNRSGQFVAASGDAAGLAHAMTTLMRDETLRAELGAANRVHVERRYTKQSCGRKYLDVYEAIAGRGPATADDE